MVMSLRVIEWNEYLSGVFHDKTPFSAEAAMTVGIFDGVHLGHRELINRVVKHGPNPTVITFRESPRKVISPETYEGDIYSLKQKLDTFDNLGVSRVILIDFSLEFSKLNGREFFNLLEEKGKIVFLAVGSNFRCGYRQDTGAEILSEMNRELGIPTEVVSQIYLNYAGNCEPVSSSRIRSAILSGDLKQAAALMGRNVRVDISDLLFMDGVYDLRAAGRIVPASGEYEVRIHPGRINGRAITKDGIIDLSYYMQDHGERIKTAESLEFL